MNTESKQVINVHIEDIIPNPFQPRLFFDDKKIRDLADSIKMHGVIEPLILRKNGEKYEIVAGERRYKASTMAGLSTVPAIVMNMDDRQSAEVALVENLQRKDLTPIEEAKSYEKLQKMGYSQEEIAKKMGVAQPTIANKLRLLNLTDIVQKALLEEKISERHARSLINLSAKDQERLLERIIDERMTVRRLQEEIDKLKETENSKNQGLTNIEDLFNLPVELSPSEPKSTNIEHQPMIDFFNVEDKKEDVEVFDPINLSLSSNKFNEELEVNPEEKSEKLSYPEPAFDKYPEPVLPAVDNRIIIKKEDFSTVKRAYDKLKNDIEAAGLKISMETFDFDEYYQLIIKVFREEE